MSRFSLAGQSILNFRRTFLFLLCRCHSAELSLKCNMRKSTRRNIPLLLKPFHFSPCIHIYAWQLITLETYCIKRLELMKSSFSVFLAKKSSLDSLSQNEIVLLKLRFQNRPISTSIREKRFANKTIESRYTISISCLFPIALQIHGLWGNVLAVKSKLLGGAGH